MAYKEHLNTSHVKLQLIISSLDDIMESYLNTSHVKLQHPFRVRKTLGYEHLNTSHVKLQLDGRNFIKEYGGEFKYISC